MTATDAPLLAAGAARVNYPAVSFPNMHTSAFVRLGIGALAIASAPMLRVRAQSALDAPTNLSHGWVGTPGVIQFQLLHRFSLGPAPTRKLTNSPTLTVATGLNSWGTVGFNYASNSDLVPAFPNEWEFFARIAALRQEAGAPVDLILQAGHNVAAASQDGGVLIARRVGPWRLLAHGAVFSHAFDSSAMRIATGAGAVLRLSKNVTLSGDATILADRSEEERLAWSAGIQFGVPYTPHSLSLHATNVSVRTLEGIARGGTATRYGFEYTIPITLRRYLPPASSAAVTHAMGRFARPPVVNSVWSIIPRHRAARIGSDTVVVDLKQFTFGKKLEIVVGTTVVWQNRDPVAHTVIADSGLFNSGLIDPTKAWRFTFTTTGTFPYHCMPHPFMKGTIVVR